MAGRSNKYFTHVKPKLDRIANWCKQGLTEKQICEKLNVGHSAFATYKHKYSELVETLKINKEFADEKVENSLYKRAIGYEYEEVKQEAKTDRDGNVIEKKMIKTIKKVAPDTTAQIFWLKNRKPKEWRDKQEIDHTTGGKEITGIQIELVKKPEDLE